MNGTERKKYCSRIIYFSSSLIRLVLDILCMLSVKCRLCARAERRRHCVGGGAPVNFSRRRRAAGPNKSAAARRGRKKTVFSKIHEKIPFYPQNFLRNFFSHQSFEVCR